MWNLQTVGAIIWLWYLTQVKAASLSLRNGSERSEQTVGDSECFSSPCDVKGKSQAH